MSFSNYPSESDDSRGSESDSSSGSSSDFYEDDFESCAGGSCPLQRGNRSSLPFDPSAIQNIILSLSDKFNMRVMMSGSETLGRVKTAAFVTSGLAVVGSVIGKHYGGNMGAAIGGAVGGACGIGIVAVSMRDIWEEVKPRLSDLFDIVYDYLGGLGLQDYQTAAKMLIGNSETSAHLAQILAEVASALLKKKVTTSIMSL